MTNKEKLKECNNFPRCHCGLDLTNNINYCNCEKRINNKIKELSRILKLLYNVNCENILFSKQWLESFMKGS